MNTGHHRWCPGLILRFTAGRRRLEETLTKPGQRYSRLRAAVKKSCEGWTLPEQPRNLRGDSRLVTIGSRLLMPASFRLQHLLTW